MNRKTTFKRALSCFCVLALLLTGMTGITPPSEAKLDERTRAQEKTNDPFSLMYDSNEKLAEEIERMPSHILDERLLEPDLSENDSRISKDTSAAQSVAEAPSIEDVADAVRSGDFESIEEFALPEESAERIQRMIEESGEDRYIVEYRSKSSADILEHDIGVEGTAYELAELTQVIVLEEKMNPAELAEILRDAGAEEDILYIQPDFALSIDSLSLTVEEVDAGEPTEDPKDEEQEADTSDSVEETEDQDEIDIDETEETGVDEPGEGENPESSDETETAEDIEDIELPEEEIPEPVLEPKPVLVAVIDTGVDVSHPMLEGYISGGWNFVDGSDDIYDDEYPLASAHGTHVAGIIVQAAEEYGADVTILPLKVFENGVAYTSHIIEAIQYAEEQGAQIINCSFGSTNENPALLEAIEASSALFICAAGNSRRDLDEKPSYPASYRLDNIISVSSVNADGGFSYFSNYSTSLVDITALGRDVVSALPGGETGSMIGTSMAAAKVSGAAAVVLSLCGAAEIEQEPPEDEEYIEPQTDEDVFTEPEIFDEVDELLPEEESGFVTESAGITASSLHITRLSDRTAARAEAESAEVELTAAELRLRLLEGADRLDNLQNKVVDGRRINLQNALASETGAYLTLTPADDFDVHGYQRTDEENWALFSSLKIVQIEAGMDHTLALASDGTVWAWGLNGYGQLGTGTGIISPVPAQVIGLSDVKSIAAGYFHSMALKSDGSVWEWGCNGGTHTLGTLLHNSIPTKVSGISGVTAIAGGEISLALKGLSYAWGYFGPGKISIFPTLVTLGARSAISVGGMKCLAIGTNGKVYEWDFYYADTLASIWNEVSGLTDVVAISQGYFHNLALKADGTVWAWGSNLQGQLGDGTTTGYTWPQQVPGLSNVSSISAGVYHSMAVKNDGTVWTWGLEDYGPNGFTNSLTPTLVNGLTGVADVAAGYSHSFALKSNGSVWAWGDNHYGQLGTDQVLVAYTPIKVIAGDPTLDFAQFANNIQIPSIDTATITVSAIAYNDDGQAIQNTSITYSLAEPYLGVSINSTTGVVTITSEAKPGKVVLMATYGSLTATAQLILTQKSMDAGENLTLYALEGWEYNISILATEIETFDGQSFTLTYDPTVLVPVDLCAFTWEKELDEGDIAGTGITIVSFTEGEIIFSVDKDIPPDKVWSGVLNTMRFKAISDESTTLSISLLS